MPITLWSVGLFVVKQGREQAKKNGAVAHLGHGAQQPAQVVARGTADGMQRNADGTFQPASV